MDKDVIYAMLEDVGFTITEKESTLSELMGTPSHLESSYEMELQGNVVFRFKPFPSGNGKNFVKGEKVMAKNDVAKEKKAAIKLTEAQGRTWKAYRDEQIQALVTDALSRDMDDATIKRLVPLAIARQIDQAHNSAERKVTAYESGTPLSLDDLFSETGRTTAKALAYEQAMDLFLEAATVDKNAAKTILRNAKKDDTAEAWEHAISELESIIGQLMLEFILALAIVWLLTRKPQLGKGQKNLFQRESSLFRFKPTQG